jgi:hypothetical protein
MAAVREVAPVSIGRRPPRSSKAREPFANAPEKSRSMRAEIEVCATIRPSRSSSVITEEWLISPFGNGVTDRRSVRPGRNEGRCGQEDKMST